MKRTSELANKTKAELTALARRKKIPVTSGMLKEDLIKTIQKGLRKIEAQKKSKVSKKISKKKSAQSSKIKKTGKPKSARSQKAPVKKKTQKTVAKKPAARKSTPSPKTKIRTELPDRYGDHRLVVMARDPNWAYAYWDLKPAKVRDLLKSAGQAADTVRWILRVYAAPLHSPEEKQHCFDVDIDFDSGNYYLNLSKPGERFLVEIGIMDPSGMFRSTAQSNPVILPLDHPANTLATESIFSADRIKPSVTSFMKPPSPHSQ